MTNYDILKEYEAHSTPLPSYKEYISLINWKEDLTNLCTAKERIIEKYENIDTWWQAENSKFKELLSECLAHLTLGEEGASVTPLNIVIDNIKEVLR